MRSSTSLLGRIFMGIALQARNDVTPKSWTVYLICFDIVPYIVQDSCRA